VDNLAQSLQTAIRFHNEGSLTEAIDLYKEIIAHDSDHADANHLVGVALLSRGHGDDRLEMFSYLKKAIKVRPDTAEYHNDLGNAFWVKRQFKQAEKEFFTCTELKPELVRAQFNLGNARFMQRKYPEAAKAYQTCISLDPNWTQAHYNLGNCLQYSGCLDQAIDAYDKVIECEEDNYEAYIARSAVLLKQGKYQSGWRDYQKRLFREDYRFLEEAAEKPWDGRPINGQSILVYAEQGIGDAIQFVRFISNIRSLGGRVTLAAEERLVALFENSLDVDEVVAVEVVKSRCSNRTYDWQTSLMSAPLLFDVSVETIPNEVPYLINDAQITEQWRQELDSSELSLGIVWAGNAAQKDNVSRSCSLEDLLPLISIPNVKVFSLQFDEARQQLLDYKGEKSITDITPRLDSFADTADFICALDLIITVDTAMAHLAGALGKPVWVLLWIGNCWRYFHNRSDSPWYPTMRLFRQQEQDNWQPVVDEVTDALRDLVDKK